MDALHPSPSLTNSPSTPRAVGPGGGVPQATAPQDDSFQAGNSPAPPLASRGHLAAAISPGAVTSSPATRPAIPDGDGLLVMPNSDGGCTAIHKIPTAETRLATDMVDAQGRALRLVPFSEGDHAAVTCLASDGTVQWRYALPAKEKVGQLVPDPAHNRVLVRGGTMLASLDATDGQEKARKDFGDLNFCRSVVAHSNGEIVVTQEKQMLRLEADGLTEIATRDLGIRPHTAQEMPDGSMFLLADGCPAEALLLGPDGETRLETHYAGLGSTVVEENGNIWMVNDHDLGTVVDHRQRSIIRYRASDRTLADFPATNETQAVVPRSDGSYLVFDDDLTHPSLILYSADGAKGPRFKFEEEGFLRQFLVTEDEQHAYAVIDRYQSGNHQTERFLARFDLPAPGGRIGSPLGRLNPFGQTQTARTIYQVGGQKQFLPAVLDDGRILVFRESGIDILHATGAVQKTVADVATLLPEIQGAKVVSRGMRLASTQDPDLPRGLESVLEAATARFGTAVPPSTPRAGEVNPRDNCLDFPVALGSSEAAAMGGVPSRAEMEELLVDHRLLNFALADEVTLPYPDGSGEVRLHQDRACVRVPDGAGGMQESHFTVEAGHTFTAAMPVRVGDHFCLAAGTSDGRLRWYEAGSKVSGVPTRVFDVGSTVVRIDLAQDHVRALGSDGRTLLFRPADAMQGMRAMQAQPATPRPGVDSPSPSGGVVVEETQVIIGGVAISRNKGT